MSLVMSSPSHGSAVSLSTAGSDAAAHHHQLVSGGSPSSSASSAKKRKRDGSDASLVPLPLQQLFPGLDAEKLQAAAAFDPTVAMLAATGMFDAQALRAVDWLNEVTSGGKQQNLQALAPGSEDMVKTASDILRSLVEHKLPSGGSDHPSTPTTAAGNKGTYPSFDSIPASFEAGERRQTTTPSKTPGEEKAAECSECGKAFKGKADLLRHIDSEHNAGATRIFRCEECPYETRHQSNLSVHRRTHTGERPYYCGACGQSYTQGHQLKTHIRSRHGGNMAFYNMDKHGMGRGPGRATFDLKMGLSGLQSSAPSVSLSSSVNSSGGGGAGGKNDKISQLLAAAAAGSSAGRGAPASSSQLPASFQGLVNASTSVADMTSPFMGMLPSHLRPFLDPASAASLALMGGGGATGNAAAAAAAANLFSQFFPFNAPAGLMPPLTATELPTASTQKSSLESHFSAATSATGSPSLSTALFADALLGNTAGKSQLTTDSLEAILGKLSATTTTTATSTSNAGNQQVDLSAGGAFTLRPHNGDDRVTTGSRNNGEVQQSQGLGQAYLQDSHRSSPSSTRPEDLSLLPAEPQQAAAQHDTNDDCMTDGEAMESGSVTSGQLTEDEGPVDACSCVESSSSDQLRHNATCQHRQQLMRLRQSVMRMLNVLAPSLGLDKAADLNTTQIDDLLHEVLFGNLDDNMSK